MKRRVQALVLVFLVAISVLSATVASAAPSYTSSKAGIKYSGKTYKVGTTSTTWKKKLGKYSRKKYDACTCGDYSYMYTYKGIKVETAYAIKKRKETVMSFVITSSKYPTANGLKVGQTVSKMKKLYGEKYKKSGTSYTYTAGNTSMIIKADKKTNKIKSITILRA